MSDTPPTGALPKKYRPKSFDDVIGNGHIISSLKKYLVDGPSTMPHTFLFSGGSGMGKTTLARIVARELGCNDNTNLMELNAANTRGIDTIRQVADEASVRPMQGKNKVFILDETHQLTPTAQEGLLKVTEDTEEYAFFLFCTTDPEKIIKTLKSRATKYEVERLGRGVISDYLTDVCDKEEVDEELISDQLVDKIASLADGSLRDGLVLLDLAMSADNDKEAKKLVERGTKYDTNVWELCQIMVMSPKRRKKKWKDALEILDELGSDAEAIRRAVMWFLADRIRDMEDDVALEFSYLLDLFSKSVFYGGKPQLVGMIVTACLSDDFQG